MDKQSKIRITKIQLDQLKKLKDKQNLGSFSDVLDLLLKNQKRYSDLENIVKFVHMRTKL